MDLLLTNETGSLPETSLDSAAAAVPGEVVPQKLVLDPLTPNDLLEPPSGEYLAICVITNEPGREVREWLDHYLRLGVRKFYVFDHGNESIVPAIKDLQEVAVVEYEQVPDRTKGWRQHVVYDLCLQRHRLHHHWIAFFDTDEFLMIKDPAIASLPLFLKGFEDFPGLVVFWRVLGSSGHQTDPGGPVLANYWMCTASSHPINEFVKTIVNTRFVVARAGSSGHLFMYRDARLAVDELQRPVTHSERISGARSADKLELYHYMTKSVEQYTRKAALGSVNKTPYKTVRWFQELNAACTDACNSTAQYMYNRTLPTMVELKP